MDALDALDTSGEIDDQDSSRSAQATLSRAVQAYEILTGSLSDAIPVSGTVSGIREAVISSESQGIIREVMFDLGSSVTEGDPLVRFDDRVEAASFRQASEQYNAAKIDLSTVQRSFDRGNASQAELSQAQAAAAGAESALEQARRQLENRTVRAAISGLIADKPSEISPGNPLAIGSRVARVVDTSRLRMRVGVGEQVVSRVQPGNPVDILVPALGAEIFRGQVQSVGAGSDPATGSFPVIIEWELPEGVSGRSGVSGTASIFGSESVEQLIVPAGSITSRRGRTVVFVELDGRAYEREVELAGRRGPRAAVRSGLHPGELVISSAVALLEDRDLVQVEVIGNSRDIR
ncbi:efflux RND transporter periplasmic adaptor subunit [Spirochaeta dissipatitropha]